MKKFLTAKWLDLIMANYTVEPEILREFAPEGTTLDLWNGKCYVSLVAFKFVETRVLGFKIPFHTNFEEVNLRFYVKRETREETKRGVCFIKEIVPRRAISLVARTFYGESYETWKMSHRQTEKELTYIWSKDGTTNHISVERGKELGVPAEESLGGFIIEHYWGYTRRGADRTDEYKIEHPKWSLFDINYAEIEVDFDFTYGSRFGFLTEAKPETILLAKGSDIAVYKGAVLR